MPAQPLPSHSCLSCQVRHGTICAPLTDAQLAEVEAIRRHDHVVRRGETLFEQGERSDKFFTVKAGWVLLSSLAADGRRKVHGFGLPGTFLGHHPEDAAPMQYTARALTDVTACVLPRDAVLKLFQQMPDLAVSFACVAWHARDDAVRRLASVAGGSARARVAQLLLDLAHQAHLSPNAKIALPLTQEDIADALGPTAVHVSRTLKGLREDGIVSTQGHVLELLDELGLAGAAGAGA